MSIPAKYIASDIRDKLKTEFLKREKFNLVEFVVACFYREFCDGIKDKIALSHPDLAGDKKKATEAIYKNAIKYPRELSLTCAREFGVSWLYVELASAITHSTYNFRLHDAGHVIAASIVAMEPYLLELHHRGQGDDPDDYTAKYEHAVGPLLSKMEELARGNLSSMHMHIDHNSITIYANCDVCEADAKLRAIPTLRGTPWDTN